MNAFSKIDMHEVTRLTRAGRLAEAMALLQGGSGDGEPAAPAPAAVRRLISRGVATTPSKSWGKAESAPSLLDLPNLTETLRGLRAGLPNIDLPGAGGAAARVARAPIPDGARFEDRSFSNAAGTRAYKVYAPSGYAGQPLPVIVMLHGCTQNPDDFAAGTRMNEIAEQQTFLVVYPQQPTSANMNKCWNWFNATDQHREGGEPSLIAGIALEVVEKFGADRNRIYAAGLSAGGAAAAVLAATHPDVFAAVGVHSGLACGAARDMPSAFAAMRTGGPAPLRGGGPRTPTIIFHGDADATVHPVNGDHVAAQAAPQPALPETVTTGETAGVAYTRAVRHDASGKPALEQWTLHGGGHAWSGGSPAGSFTDPRGPDASREMVRFFGQHALR